MKDAHAETIFETINHGVRTRRSQHQVTYDLPNRPFIPLFGVVAVLNIVASAILWLGPLSVASIIVALLMLLVELALRTRRKRIILTPERLSLQFRYPWRKPFTCGWDAEEIRSIERVAFPINGLVLRARKMASLYMWQRKPADEYLYTEIAAWLATRSSSSPESHRGGCHE